MRLKLLEKIWQPFGIAIRWQPSVKYILLNELNQSLSLIKSARKRVENSNKMDDLLQLVKNDDFKGLRAALQNPDPEIREAIQAEKIQVANFKNSYLNAPLHYASYMGKSHYVEILLDAGFNLDMATNDNAHAGSITALHAAVLGLIKGEAKNWNAVELLIDRGADVSLEGSQYLALSGNWIQLRGTALEFYLNSTKMDAIPKPSFSVMKKLIGGSDHQSNLKNLPLDELVKRIKAKPELEKSIQAGQKIENQMKALQADPDFIESKKLRRMEQDLDELNRVTDALDIAREKKEIAEANQN